MDLLPTEVRVLGCLLEKQVTTPETYPLSLNALRAACNQSTNRDPVVDYDDATVRDALNRLGHRRWTRLTSGPGSRAPKFRHLLEEALPLPRPARAVLTVLMLRGAQTPGELKQRADRLSSFPDLGSVHEALETLIAQELVQQLARRPGQKEERYRHLLGDDALETFEDPPAPPLRSAPPAPSAPPASSASSASSASPASPASPADDRLARLEAEVAALREEVRGLRELG